MEDIAQDKVYCSDSSLQADEPLIASATLTTQFILLEYNGAWGEKAYEESDIASNLKAHLNVYAGSHPNCKILLIRSPRSLAEPGVRFIGAQLSAGPSQVYDFHFEGYEGILSIDLPALFAGQYGDHLRTSPVYLVCTHGRRDRCCSRWGIPVYNTLLETAQRADEQMGVWQSSHIGGHRFAANLISLSSGVLYGRVRPEAVPAILAAERSGKMHLENVRGRLAYPPPAQAAEWGLRREIGELGLGALHLEQIEPAGDSAWVARFAHTDERRFLVRIHAHKAEMSVYESCSLDKTTPIIHYSTVVEPL